jgi:hypothetical protein
VALTGVSIVKQVSFRGVFQEFSNVYHYEGDAPSASAGTALATAIKAIEVPLHSSDVTFLRYSVWSAGGAPGANQMIVQGFLSGTGSQSAASAFDRERAILVQWPAGFDVRGHRVYLRKWYHCCGGCAGWSATNPQLQNTGQIDSASRTLIGNAADDLLTITAGGITFALAAPSGRNPDGATQVHPYLEHRQLGDMWR